MIKRTMLAWGAGLGVLMLAGCVSAPAQRTSASAPPAETVMVTYHVKAGQEAAFQDVLSRAWAIYQQDHLVYANPHVVVREKENGGQTTFTEIFTWISGDTPDNPSEAVKAIFSQMQSLCEDRNGHNAIEIGDAALVVP
jgi:hypothetical protein